MSVAAGLDCLTGVNPKSVDRLYFASTTPPYKEKQSSATIATALDLSKEALTIDFSNSLRCGTNAITAAVDAVSSGSAKKVLVCAADTRLGHPGGAMETSFGDGAAALLIGEEEITATIEGSYSLFDETLDVWRADRDLFVHAWEDRFILEQGYIRVVQQAILSVLSKYGLSTKDFSKVAISAPGLRQAEAVSKAVGFDPKTQVQGNLFTSVGDTGSALALMSLVSTLEEAKTGDLILLANYGNGCDVFILKVINQTDRAKEKRGVKGYLATKRAMSSYQRYLRWRQLVDLEPPKRPDPQVPSAVALWRDTQGGLALYGSKCRNCGALQYPAQRVCMICQAKDNFDSYRFADKVGNLTTFSQDNLAVHPDPPAILCAVDFPDGGRIMCDMTDCDPQEVKVGIPVEMTFRRLLYVGGFYNYWWKCRPMRFW